MQIASMTCSMSFLLLLLLFPANAAITPNHPLIDGATIVSPAGLFELGFFSPPRSTSRYVGIWYKNIPSKRYLWVANRDTPLTNSSSGVLSLTGDGNLSLHSFSATLWTTNTSSLTNPTLHLLDSGNLVLSDGSNTNNVAMIAWQSFDHPSDTMLPGMKIGWNLATKHDTRLRSWTSPSDPSPGIYSFNLILHVAPDMYLWNGTSPEIRSGPWDGQSWGAGAALRSRDLLTNTYVVTSDDVYFTYDMTNKSVTSMLVLDFDGVLRRLVWRGGEWSVYWLTPSNPCDLYGHCGAYGVCNSEDSPVCGCLLGFVPKASGMDVGYNPEVASDGCVRRTELGCGGDGFVKVSGVRMPDTTNATADESKEGVEECREGCLRSCSCLAFTFMKGYSGCITWTGELVDVRQLAEGNGQDFYLRVAAADMPVSSDQPRHKKHVWLIVILVTSLALFILGTLMYFVYIRRQGKRGTTEVSSELLKFATSNNIAVNFAESDERGMKFSIVHFSVIVDATNNFSEADKLGEGGFGSVYKGQLLKGQDIAVKRLAKCSGQGLEEFENEIVLISKLQHTNLVRLLGFCVHEDEKMLIYEYMSNRSLDFYIFNSSGRKELNWCRRFQIIEGIAQGLLYLHKHSRLRIIHRDLKASNILLDADMNPKISDFGMARIFGSQETQANTKRVVGTYGYMAPEYASEGLFSVKSDVFSFGILLLEIISGRKNNIISQNGNSLNIQGYAWVLWKEKKLDEFVDPFLDGACNMSEVYRCIHLALLCVQESFVDRPTMSEVIAMLISESEPTQDPKHPAFFNLRVVNTEDLLENVSTSYSINELTITAVDSR